MEPTPKHDGFVWLREGYPKIGEWYDDGNTFEPASMNWRASGNKVHVYTLDAAGLVARVAAAEWQPSEVMYSEVGVLRDRLEAVEHERDWLRSLVDDLAAALAPQDGE